MKRLKLVFLVLILVPISISAQRIIKYEDVDEDVLSFRAPIITEKNMADVAFAITEYYDADSLKARAIFTFVANYYDYDKYAAKEGFGTATREGFGVGWQYAQLFSQMTDAIGLDSRMIYGWGKKTYKDVARKNKKSYHTWNMIYLNGAWQPIDCAWASGYYDKKERYFVHKLDPHYFCTNPRVFALTHQPDDGFEYIAFKEQTEDEFILSPLYHTTNFPDQFYFTPSGPNNLYFDDSDSATVTFNYIGEIPPGTWTVTNRRGKGEVAVTPDITESTISFSFNENIDIDSYMMINYKKKPLITIVIGGLDDY